MKKYDYKIISAKDPQWCDFFNLLPEKYRDPFFSAGYFNLQDTSSKLLCFIVTYDNNLFFYPFIKTNINNLGFDFDENYFDIEGIYGYNGSLIKSNSNQFIKESRELFINYCINENIIAEFMRFNPIYKNHLFFNDMDITCVNKNIVVNLKDDNIWMNQYEHSTRKNINKAIKNNLKTKIIKSNELSKIQINKFTEIYYKTMNRNSASEEYYFQKEYFHKIKDNLPNNSLFVFVYKADIVVSVELVLYNSYIGYSFLGGTLSDYFSYRPNDYLKHTIIQYLQKKCLKYFCLGGGVALNDGIFKYKKCFSKNGIYDFFIGKSIYNKKIYDLVVEQWRDKTNLNIQQKYKNYLLKYHYS